MSDYWERKDIHFAVLGLIFGILFMIAVPPFQTPDEPNHFFRCYQISQGDFLSERRGKSSGGEIPESLPQTVNKIVDNIAFHPRNKQNINDIFEAFHIPLEKDKKKFIGFSNTAIYSPVPYMPQVIGVSLGKLIHASPLVLMYMGRFFNLLFSISLITCAIRIAPFFKNVIFLLAMMPMSVHQIASLSPDASTIGLSFLLISGILRFAYASDVYRLNKKHIFFLLVVSALTASCKTVYFPVVFLYFIIPVSRLGSLFRYISTGMFIIFIALCCFFIWGAAAEERIVVHLYGGMPFKMAKLFIISHPLGYAERILRNLSIYLPFYICSFIGILGWLDTELSIYFIVIYGITLILTGLTDGERNMLLPRHRIIMYSIASACVILVITSQYFIWTLLTSTDIGMAQGRYFIPFAPFIFMGLYNNFSFFSHSGTGVWKQREITPKTIAEFTSFFAIAALIYTLLVVIQRYYYT